MAIAEAAVKANLRERIAMPESLSKGRHFSISLARRLSSAYLKGINSGDKECSPNRRRNSAMSTTGTNRFLDEFAKLMTDAAGAAQGVRKEAEAAFHAQADRWLNSLDVVRREEFDAVREMAIKARDENDALRARIEALEAKLSAAKD